MGDKVNPLNWNLGFGFDLGQLGSSIINYYSQQKTNEANRNLAELAYQQNVEQWHRENAYNLPSAQMQRLQDAGLNPNLVYGSGSAVQTSARSPQMSYPQMQSPQVNFSTPMSSSVVNNPLVSSQVSVQRSQAELNQAQVIKTIAESKGLDAKTKYQLIQNMFASEREQLQIQLLNQQIEHFDKQWEVFASQIDVNVSVRDMNVEQANKLKKELRILGINADQAQAMYDKWYKHGLTPAQGWKQMTAQLAWLALQLPSQGEPEISVNDGLTDEEFEKKYGYKRYSDRWWGKVNEQSQYKQGSGWSSIY